MKSINKELAEGYSIACRNSQEAILSEAGKS
jgi:hypothetical protein